MKVTAIIILFWLCASFSPAQSWQWAMSTNEESYYSGKTIDQDSSSNLYVTGTFTGTKSFGSFTLSSDNPACFIAKLNPGGSYLWVKKVNAEILDVAAMDDGVVIAGGFKDTFQLNSFSVLSSGGKDAFILKLNSSGNLLWFKQGVGTNDAEIKSIRLKDTIIFCGGTNGGSMLFNGANFTTGAFAMTLGVSGTAGTHFQIGGSADLSKIDADSDLNFYLICKYTDSIVIGGNTSHAGYYGSHFIAKYANDGSFIWVKDLGSNYYTSYDNFVATNSGDIYLVKNNRYSSIIMTKLSSAGNTLWNKYYGGSVYDIAFDLELDDQDNLYMAGSFWYNGNYGGAGASGTGSCLFLTKLDSAGNGEWVRSAVSDNNGFVYGLESSFNNGDGYLKGISSGGNADFDGNLVTGMFLAKISQNLSTVNDVPLFPETIVVFPNPASDKIRLSFTGEPQSISGINIYNAEGKLVYKEADKRNIKSLELDIAYLPKGIYSIEILYDKKRIVKKFIAE
jgi:hypothetical protein